MNANELIERLESVDGEKEVVIANTLGQTVLAVKEEADTVELDR